MAASDPWHPRDSRLVYLGLCSRGIRQAHGCQPTSTELGRSRQLTASGDDPEPPGS
jgi:hypothetical protein